MFSEFSAVTLSFPHFVRLVWNGGRAIGGMLSDFAASSASPLPLV